MLSVTEIRTSGRDQVVEVFASGRARVVFGDRELETWLDSWVVDQIADSFSPQISGPQSGEMDHDLVATIACFDTEEETDRTVRLRGDAAEHEASRISSWLVLRVHGEAGLPLFGSWAVPPYACDPDRRRDWGLDVERPAWCEEWPLRPSIEELDDEEREELRKQLRERLRRLPRGLQDADAGEDDS